MDDLNEVGFVLDCMEKKLGFPHASRLGEQYNAERICFLGEGLLGLVARFLTVTRDQARLKNRLSILPEDLKEAAELLVSASKMPFNPFAVDDLRTATRRPEPAAAGTVRRRRT